MIEQKYVKCLNESYCTFHVIEPVCEQGVKMESAREMKFSDKPGSAVVYYKNGQTFHISYLTRMSVFDEDGDILISVSRLYSKDGLLFKERVGIPPHMFDKVVWKAPGNEEADVKDYIISYDPEARQFITHVVTEQRAVEIDFT